MLARVEEAESRWVGSAIIPMAFDLIAIRGGEDRPALGVIIVLEAGAVAIMDGVFAFGKAFFEKTFFFCSLSKVLNSP